MQITRIFRLPQPKHCCHTVIMNIDALSPELLQRLQALQKEFLLINAQINLSALRTEEACYNGNILDSLAALELLEALSVTGDSIIDIGTGGGFPLLPLAMALPDRNFVGLDSIQKKLTAIATLTQKFNLSNVQLICARCEDIGRDKNHREHYAIVTNRAVAPLNVLLEYSAPLVQPNGYIICWKSVHIQEELHESLAARSELRCHLINTISYTLPGNWGTRQLLVFQKTGVTPKKYPRETGIPKKTPLL